MSLKNFLFEVLQEKKPVTGPAAARKIKHLSYRHSCKINEIRSFFSNPEACIGSYNKLPIFFCSTLESCADFYLKEKNCFSTPLLKQIGRGVLFKAGGRTVKIGWIVRDKYTLNFLGKALISVGRSMIITGNKLSNLFLDTIKMNLFYKAPLLVWLIRYAKSDASNLIRDYIKNIPTHPHHSPVFKLSDMKTTAGALIGIDLLPSNGKLYFIECNSNPGHNVSRHYLFKDGDTVCNHLVQWVEKQGYSRILFFPKNDGPPFEEKLEDGWRKITELKNIKLKIIDDPYLGTPYNRQYDRFFDYALPDTLIVNGRYLWGPLSGLVGTKGHFDDVIKSYNVTVEEKDQIPMPRKINSDDQLSLRNTLKNFPNIIIKNKYVDRAQGITLYRTKQVPEYAKSKEYVAYEYVKPDLFRKNNDQEFAYGFRCYLLVTPSGPVYLGAKKNVSGTPVEKNSLSYGNVQDIAPYITNTCIAGDYSVPHSPDENEKCRDATLKLGHIIYQNLIEQYNLTVNSSNH